ncbi:uncharacterized protein LOC122802279 [Protopterus annectens]|uniref:uncharacterized protein LOC122802279 n=1 Tax=Protopterus annectens TaxID=7888 RepID=UPI001CFBD07E|nr:uncharacterized protein LOC122802279 [Protopterus annectens]
MTETNSTISHPVEFILTGFVGIQSEASFILLAFSVMYILTIAGNITIIITVAIEESLHEPMYILLCMLALSDLVLCNTVLPKMLAMLWFMDNRIRFEGCFIQMFFVHMFSVIASSALLTMSFDRYCAVCNPLRYRSIFTNIFLLKLCLACLGRGIFFTLPLVWFTLRLHYCSSNLISISYCDHMSLVKLACDDTTLNNVYGIVTMIVVIGLDSVLILFSYIKIIQAVMKLDTGEAKQKALNTCGSHLSVVFLTYISAVFSLTAHRLSNVATPNVLATFSCIYLVLPGVLNPIIYGVRTKEIRKSFMKHLIIKRSKQALMSLKMGNETNSIISGLPVEFTLTTFSGNQMRLSLISVPFLFIYMLSMGGNVTILVIIKIEESLHEPMYIFLCMLAIINLVTCNIVLPKILAMLWFRENKISFETCLTQMFFIHIFSAAESSVLVAMSFDRYTAICNPLRYTNIFSNAFMLKIGLLCYIRGIILIIPEVWLASRLPYCTSRIIPISYCDHMSVVKLACTDTTVSNVYGIIVISLIVLVDFVLIVLSYIKIFQAVLNIGSREEYQKALNTCGSHLSVVLFQYITASFSFITQRLGKVAGSDALVLFSCLYVILPAMLNPIIYGIRTKEIRKNILKHLKISYRFATVGVSKFYLRTKQLIYTKIATLQKILLDLNCNYSSQQEKDKWLEFILTTFSGTQMQLCLISAPFIVMYALAIAGNITLMVIVKIEESLHEPMYILLCMLAIIDLVSCNIVLPKLLAMLWFRENKISFEACLIQMFFIHIFSAAESSVLVAMSFDRYTAICNPLRYISIFTNAFLLKIGLACFTRGIILLVPEVWLASRLPYCTSRIIPISYCDHMSIVRLACTDTTASNIYGIIVIALTALVDFALIVLSYTKIFRAVLNIGSRQEYHKALNTCGSHLCVVLFAYIGALFSFITQRFNNVVGSDVLVTFSCLYVVLPVTLNPIIYGIRTKEIRDNIVKLLLPREKLKPAGIKAV